MPDIGSLGEMTVSYGADLSGLESGSAQAKNAIGGVADAAQSASSRFLGHISDMGAGMLHFVGGIGNAIGSFESFYASAQMLGFQFQNLFHSIEEHQNVMAQTAQALRSTKDVSGETVHSIDDLAASLSRQTRFSADSIQEAENLELTFTNIGQSVFPQTTQAILDVSQAMGQDLKSSAIQVGKALGEPLTGMSALQRIGVTFSATEKEQIKTMMAHNDIIGAQKIILHELTTEFGGSAQAAGKTFAGQLDILKNRFEELKIKIGSALIPVFTSLIGVVNPLLDDILNLQINTNALSGIFTTIGAWVDNITVPAFNDLRAMTYSMSPVFSTLGTTVSSTATPAFQAVSNIASSASHEFTNLSGIVRGSTDQAFGVLSGDLKASVIPNLEKLSTTVSGDVNSSMTNIQPVISSMTVALGSGLVNAANSVGSALSLVSTITSGVFQTALEGSTSWIESSGIPVYTAFSHVVGDVLGGNFLKAKEDALEFVVSTKVALAGLPSSFNFNVPNAPNLPGGLKAPHITVDLPQLDGVIKPLQDALAWMQSTFEPGIDAILSDIQNVGQSVEQVLNLVFQPWVDTFNQVVHDLAPDFEQFGEWWQTTMNPTLGASGTHVKNLYQDYSNLVHGIGQVVEAGIRLGLIFTETFGPIIVMLGQVAGWLLQNQGLVHFLAEAIVGIGIAIAGLKIVSFFADLATKFAEVGKGIQNIVNGDIPKLQKAVESSVEETIIPQTELAASSIGNIGTTAETTMAEGVATGSLEARVSLEGMALEAGYVMDAEESIGTTATTKMAEGVAAGAAESEASLEAVGAEAATTTAGIGSSFLGLLGPIGMVASIGIPMIIQGLQESKKNVDQFAQDFKDNLTALQQPLFTFAGLANQVFNTMQQKAIAATTGFSQDALNLISSMGDAGKSITENASQDTEYYFNSVAQMLANLQAQANQTATMAYNAAHGIHPGEYRAAMSGNDVIASHATGGIIQPGQYGIVGDQGSEMVYGGSSGISVLPHPQTMAALSAGYSPAMYSGGGSGGDNEYHFHIELGGREIGYTMASDSGFVDAIGTGVVKRIRQLSGGKR